METRPRVLRHYLEPNGDSPFQKWLVALKDRKGAAKIRVRLDRVERGNFGARGSVGSGVHELKIDFGPGYRVYYGLDGNDVILLGGGSKSTQPSDIQRAIERWEKYNA